MKHPALLGNLLSWSSETWRRKTALVFRGRRLTFRDIDEGANSLARSLRARGLRPSERVGLYMENRPEYLHAYFAIPRAGGVTVPLSTFLAPAELREILRDSSAAMLVTSVELLARIAPDLEVCGALRDVLVCGGGADALSARGLLPRRINVHAMGASPAAEGNEDPEGGAAASPDDTAVIIYTSGTTGSPKGVMLSHRNLLSNAEACIEAVGVTSRDRIILFLPMFHSFTLMVGMLAPMMAGMTIILCERVDRGEIRRAIMRHRPTILPAVPAVFAAMSHARVGRLARWLNPVRIYISGGAPLSLETLQRFEEKYRRPLCEGYGLSEASPVVALNPPSGPRKAGSVGIPLPGIEVRIVDPEGSVMAPGETGELQVRAASVMKGYAGRPDETAAALSGEWLRTGDLARVDEDRFIFIMGRLKEMLIFRGMNIYPREIEEVLEAHPRVKEAAVIGVPDAARGEIPYAFVAPHDGASLDERELRRLCVEKLARYKVPRGFRIVQELPRNAAGKVLKQALREESVPHPSG
ncbi:MAG TPA: long-chain fatty acid--CoA ligase [Candidatus Polarisedimenticolia bacterium]|jgi:long-chain acyl-CoA synthetase